ncbi:MAG: hypothetical protein F6K23_31550 [Okeania sp. SIO2C9]|uniref:hypothetical protein n=1 Tax=Okeania sp. SIO2C9 TaxID=2607791 RepID=UPI0013C193BE|nr:hypothetical protein [Okeania sp. SIO2C9]NEQ77149.1 hypothetical protein [Okeania sp. SIO2C9]
MRRVFSRASQNENVVGFALKGDGGKNKYLLKAPQDDNISGTASKKIPKDERSPFSRKIWLNKLNKISISDFSLLPYTQ